MAAILSVEQRKLLLQGEEKIKFNRFDYRGVYYPDTETAKIQNVLMQCPRDLRPINTNLVKSYGKPVKKVTTQVKVETKVIKNTNPNFTAAKFVGIHGWTIGEPTDPGSDRKTAVIADVASNVKAISGQKYAWSAALYDASESWNFLLQSSAATVRANMGLQVGFYHYLRTSATAATYLFKIQVKAVDGSNVYWYNFQTNEWVGDTGGSQISQPLTTHSTKVINKWNSATISMQPYQATNNDINLTLYLYFPEETATNGTHSKVYIDNCYIAEIVPTEGRQYIINRKTADSGRVITSTLKDKPLDISNEISDLNVYNNGFTGAFRRERDTADKTIEQIVTQEKINDSRDYVTRFEGDFINAKIANTTDSTQQNFVSPKNKIFMDYGEKLLQEPVSCYIDSMSFNIKKNQYKLKLRTPDQNNDLDTYYWTIFQ